MTVYADLVFLLNSCIDFLLLWLTSGIRKQRTTFWRLLSASLLGGSYATLHLWPEFTWLFSLPAKILVSMIMVGCVFGFHHPMRYLRNLGVFYLVCFVTGGAMIAIHTIWEGDMPIQGGIILTKSSKVSWLFLALSFPLVWAYTRLSFGSILEKQRVEQFITPVRIHIEKKALELKGLVDTGNQLRDPVSRAPVMMVELAQIEEMIPKSVIQMVKRKDWFDGWADIPPEWMVKLRLIPFRAAGSDGEMLVAFKPDQVEIWQENQWNNVGKVLIGIDVGRISQDDAYQAILHPSCLAMFDSYCSGG